MKKSLLITDVTHYDKTSLDVTDLLAPLNRKLKLGATKSVTPIGVFDYPR